MRRRYAHKAITVTGGSTDACTCDFCGGSQYATHMIIEDGLLGFYICDDCDHKQQIDEYRDEVENDG